MSAELMKYQAYLRSKTWKRIRQRVLDRDGWKCRSCGARATEVHHGAYDAATMRGETLERLYAVCRHCHEAITFDVFGLKRKAGEVRWLSWMLGNGKPKSGRKHRKRARAVPRRESYGTVRVR